MKKTINLLLAGLLLGCTPDRVTPQVDCTGSDLELAFTVKKSGCQEDSGEIQITGTGGELPYQFFINDKSSDSGDFNGLSAGVYSAKVQDAKGCIVEGQVSVDNEDGVNIVSVKSENTPCGKDGGTITIAATGGSLPYTFKMADGKTSDTGEFSGLGVGNYDISVTDNNGCSSQQQVSIIADISLINDIMPIIKSNCVGCHSGRVSPNLSTAEGVIANATRVRNITKAGDMPPSGPLSDDKIDEIACWVSSGALNN
ncbi:c-type cytochrome [Fulvivirga sediminis]|uniref:Cytochrome c n=1 Tax=Fulvivirga sediminis TaxID=2803949 RepID=A0A937F730_9BACT|nr:cytochrome c [Fulvivirga sediminis]MBL3655829.1 cytochrome c [Fulvivirga sediminis]